MRQRKIIAVDIDGVLTDRAIVGREEFPKVSAIEELRTLRVREYVIVLFTARDITLKTQTLAWLQEHNVPYDDIIFDKPRYDCIIDDKAFKSIKELLATGLW